MKGLISILNNIIIRQSEPHVTYIVLQAQVGEKHKYKAIKHSNSFPVYRLYLHIHMLIQKPLSDTPIIVFNTCITLIFNPML